MSSREHYGLDAPTVVRNLALAGSVLIIAGLFLTKNFERFGLALLIAGFAMAGTAVWMVISSFWFKKRVMRTLLNQRQWRGNESALDVGCGRGLVTIEVARRAPSGSIHAIDLWQGTDLSGNRPEALLVNARAAGVADRLTIDTGDARKLPYPDASYDVVTSMTAIHNIPDAAGRETAIAEIWRVTRPGGQILIFDIQHARSYLGKLREFGAVDAKISGPIFLWAVIGWRLSVLKPAAEISMSRNSDFAAGTGPAG